MLRIPADGISIAARAALFLTLCSCASVPNVAANNAVYDDPRAWEGKVVSVSGYLSFEMEDKNIYKTQERQHYDSNCLPVAINRSQADLISKAKRLSGQRVIVTGVVAKLVADDEIVLDFCRKTGVRASSIALE